MALLPMSNGLDAVGWCAAVAASCQKTHGRAPSRRWRDLSLRDRVLKNPWNLTDAQRDSLFHLTRLNLRLVRAYLLKESFQLFWHYKRRFYAERFLRDWLWKAIHSRLGPMKKFAQLVRSHIEGILAWTTSRISNGVLQGLNNKVKLVSHRAFGFRTIPYYIAAIYHVCADLPLRNFEST